MFRQEVRLFERMKSITWLPA